MSGKYAEGQKDAARLRLGPSALYLIADERDGGAVVAELSPARDRATVALPVGRYFVQRRDADEYREYRVALAAGQELDLQLLPFRSVRYDHLVRKGDGTRARVQGFTALIGGRGEALPGEGPTPHLILGYQLDLPWLTLGLRARGMSALSDGIDLPRRHTELGFGLSLARFVDLSWLSVAVGVLVEGIYHRQGFESEVRVAQTRQSAGLSFSAFLAGERQIFRGLSLHVEGAPVALVFSRARIADGMETGNVPGAAVSWWVAGGLVWRM